MGDTIAVMRLCLFVALFAFGCNSSPAPVGTDRPVQMPTASNQQTERGPSEADLPKALDLPLYPGATLVASQQVTGKDIPSTEKRYRVALTTPDSAKKVGEFYKDKGKTDVATTGAKVQVMGFSPKGFQIIIAAEPDPAVKATKIAISVIAH